MKNSLRASGRILLLSLGVLAPVLSAPVTAKRPVTDEYQGVKVTDDYRWLENWGDPEVKQWSAVQSARSRDYLDHLPARRAVKERVTQLLRSVFATYSDLQFRGGILFVKKDQPPQQQPIIVALRSADDFATEKVIFDPNATSAKGSISVDFFVPSLDGKYVAAAVSSNGSEDSNAHVFEVTRPPVPQSRTLYPSLAIYT